MKAKRQFVLLMSCLLMAAKVAEGQSTGASAFDIALSGVTFGFKVVNGTHLRLPSMLPTGYEPQKRPEADGYNAFEVFLQCSGEMSTGHNGHTGINLKYIGHRESDLPNGKVFVVEHLDTEKDLKVESFYEFISDAPVARRYVRITNLGQQGVGLSYLSSAIINNVNEISEGSPEDNIRLHYAYNSHMNEAQWQVLKPSQIGRPDGFAPNHGKFKVSNLGSMSTRNYLPMGMLENVKAGVTWFWQIEHNGSWSWSVGDMGKGTYVYIGGPDEESSHAWKLLEPGEVYQTVPVAIGVVRGGLDEAVAALTSYRRHLIRPHEDNCDLPVYFNDYLHCLWADPTTAKVLPLIDRAAEVGCDYYVMDAGWYSELGEGWYDKVGKWEPTESRFPNGLSEVMDSIRSKGMKPGIWLEIEVAGINSVLKDKPDNWFLTMHGKRVQDGARYLLDFRNPEVIKYLDDTVDELISRYGIKFFKIDYNSKATIGSDENVSSPGQGLLEHNRAVVNWYKSILDRYPDLTIESCSSGGNRLDYAMLSQSQFTSSSDQEDYRKIPAIVVGEMVAVLPEQLGIWAFPREGGDAREASFNMVNGMMGRIYLGGELSSLPVESTEQVKEGIRVYKEKLVSHISESVPFFPLGLPSIGDDNSPIALGLKGKDKAYVAVWRLNGEEDIVSFSLSDQPTYVKILYPTNLDIEVVHNQKSLDITLPDKYTATIIEVRF